jgi:hypothetical protein
VLKVHARLLGDYKPIQLFSQELEILPALAAQLDEDQLGLYFDWSPDSSRYQPHAEHRSASPDRNPFSAVFPNR